MKTVKAVIKSEIVLILSFVFALISMCFVKPSMAYIDAIDFKTLSLLFCLMLVMEGFKSMGIFAYLAEKLLMKVTTIRGVGLVLSLLCFFSSMLITNDVALITFVPFTIVALKLSHMEKHMIPLVTIETVAANLGSMATPIGNPQNLYLFSYFEMSAGTFFKAVFPYALLSLILTVISVWFMGKETVTTGNQTTEAFKWDKKRCILYGALFVLSLLTVFRVIPYQTVLLISIGGTILTDKQLLKRADYSLLFTFIFLFIFIGNLGKIPYVNQLLQDIISGREVPVAILSSQVFSNVPAAILLSGFTERAHLLLVGTNLGGLGTLIASMASLISFKFLVKEQINTAKYLLVFTGVNIAFLLCNILLWICIS